MESEVGKVPIDNLTVGMILKSDVFDRSGRLLLPSGAELSEKHLQIFRMWGVLEVEIVAGTEPEGETSVTQEFDPERAAKAEEMLLPLFVHNDLEHPAIKELLRLCISRKVTDATW